MTTRAVARNTFFLSAAQGVRILLALALILYIANGYGPVWQGKFSILLAFLNIFQVLASFGLPRLITRNVARAYPQSNHYYWAGLAAQGLTTVAMMGVMAGVVAIMPYPPETRWMLWVAVLALPLFTFYSLAGALLRAIEQMQYLVYAELLSASAQLIAAILLLSLGGGVIILAVIRVTGIGLAAMVVSLAARRRGLIRKPQWDWPFSRALLRESLDFFGMAGLDALTQRLDVLVLSVVAGEAVTGVYDAAFQIIKVLTTFILAFTDAVYPAISRLFTQDRALFRQTWRRYLHWGFAALIPVALLLSVSAPWIVAGLYRHAGYEDAVRVLQVLAWAVLFYFVYIYLSRALMAGDRPRAALVLAASMVSLGVGLLALGARAGAAPGAALGLTGMYAFAALAAWLAARAL